VLGNLDANQFPSGAALQRLNCQKTSVECADKCGFTSGGPAFP